MRVMVVAAHPDDEALGLGATLARHSAAGHEVRVLLLGDGALARVGPEGIDTEAARALVEKRHQACAGAAEALGIPAPVFAEPMFPDNRFDSVPLLAIVKAVESAVAEFGPELVYTHHGGDLNIDHRLAFQAALTACRPGPGPVRRILTFETPSSTEWSAPDPAVAFLPQVFVDAAPYWEAKKRALAAYGDEMRPFPHPRSLEYIEARARCWGAAAGLELAEAFMLVREVAR